MAPEVLAALTAGGVSLVLAVFNVMTALQQNRRVRELEQFRSDLALQQASDKARIDYEYEARRRLHSTSGPALFQLMDLAEYAIEMIKRLTDPEVWVELAKSETQPPTEVRPTLPAAKYETVAELYGLYAPLVVIRNMGRNLSQLDLSLEPVIELQYFLASKIYGSVKDDAELAAIDPVVAYTPGARGWRHLRETEPRTYWWQGLSMGRLEGMLDLMTARPESRQARVLSFGEFERLYTEIFADDNEGRRKVVAAAANALYRFRPADRPVFWRIVLAQARLYQALLRSRATSFQVPTSAAAWQELLRLEDADHFRWRSIDHGEPPLEETLAVTDQYLDRKVVDAWQRQHPATHTVPAAQVSAKPRTGPTRRAVRSGSATAMGD
jgi:hypothetical protein